MILSIVIPVYNEVNTIGKIIINVDSVELNNFHKQIIVVDDFSSDGTREYLKELKSKRPNYTILFHNRNCGKGRAIRTALEQVIGDYTIIQDADLEYDPNDYFSLLEYIQTNKLKILYGSRVLEHNNKEKIQNFSQRFRIFANYVLTKINNIINDQKLTDAHTCYKLFDSELFKSITLKENGFAFCPEITTKVSILNYKIYEIPINYKGRNYKDGKKIKFRDGIEAIIALIKYRYFKSI